jgi:glycosyltransferase involved in cell wall biosynthesis
MYKILHVVSSIDISTGGPARSITSLLQELSKDGLEVHLMAGISSNPIITELSDDFGRVHLLNTNLIGSFKNYTKVLERIKPSLIHIHGVWQLPCHQLAKWARNNNVPYIISPRGMLEPWSLNQSSLKKKLALFLYQKNDLKHAAVVHTTSEMESRNFQKLGLNESTMVIPNGISLSQYSINKIKAPQLKRTLLFLSRIHEKKGIEILISAWQRIPAKYKREWQVRIVGEGDPNYMNSLIALVQTLNLSDEIQFIGPKYGPEKIDEYQNADLFVLPTHSENFGMVIAEALASGLPVITTKGTPWGEIITHNCGWWISLNVDNLVSTLENVMSLSDIERIQMGLRGRSLIEEKYSINAVAEKMSLLYKWLLKGGPIPNFVYNE